MKGQLLRTTFLTFIMVTLLLSSFVFNVSAAATAPVLGSANEYGLMGISMSNTNPTFVAGSVGSDGQTSMPTITVGANFLNDAAYHTANLDLGLAIDNANAQACTSTGQAGDDLGGQTFQTGVYCYPGAVNVTGTLTLNGPGVIIFKVDGAFNTAANAVVQLINEAQAANVFFVVAGASTLGANTLFKGTLMSKAAITVDTSTIEGRILSQPAVTISTSTITVPYLKLILSALCTDTPLVNRIWNVHNPNTAPVLFSYEIQGTVQTGTQTVPANSNIQITTATENTNVMNLLINGVVQSFTANAGAPCTVPTASPTPTTAPTPAPTSAPTAAPTATPTAAPTEAPTASPIAAPTASPTAAPTASPTAIPTAAPTAVPIAVAVAIPVAKPVPTTTKPNSPVPVVVPGPCIADPVASPVLDMELPDGAKLISKKSSELMIWHLANGNLLVKAILPDKRVGTGIWSLNLGGQIYMLNGSEGVTFTIIEPPVGTYKAAMSFADDCGQPVTNLMDATISVPTITGGTLPNTATPWYNLMLLGTILLFAGTVIWRTRKLRD